MPVAMSFYAINIESQINPWYVLQGRHSRRGFALKRVIKTRRWVEEAEGTSGYCILCVCQLCGASLETKNTPKIHAVPMSTCNHW